MTTTFQNDKCQNLLTIREFYFCPYFMTSDSICLQSDDFLYVLYCMHNLGQDCPIWSQWSLNINACGNVGGGGEGGIKLRTPECQAGLCWHKVWPWKFQLYPATKTKLFYCFVHRICKKMKFLDNTLHVAGIRKNLFEAIHFSIVSELTSTINDGSVANKRVCLTLREWGM